MDYNKIGTLIYTLRRERQYTQRQLADRLHISDKTVSKWERGLGCPDVSLLPALSRILGVDLEHLLSGELEVNDLVEENMKKMKFYVCPCCGALLTSTAEADISCCGKKLQALTARKADDADRLSVEKMETQMYVSTSHEMSKEHYISFVALLNDDTMTLKKLYPEWNLQVRLPYLRYGLLVWYCTVHGLFYQLIANPS